MTMKRQPEIHEESPDAWARHVARLSYILGARAQLAFENFNDNKINEDSIQRVQIARKELDEAVSWLINSMQRQVIASEIPSQESDEQA